MQSFNLAPRGDEAAPRFLFGKQIAADIEHQFYGQNDFKIPTRASTGFLAPPFVPNMAKIENFKHVGSSADEAA